MAENDGPMSRVERRRQTEVTAPPRRWPLWAGLGAVGLVAAIVGGGIVAVLEGTTSEDSGSTTTGAVCSAIAVADRDLPSVVMISAQADKAESSGAGTIIRRDGHILTSASAVSADATGSGTIRVLFSSGTTAAAKLVGRDPQTDLAVVKIEAKTPLPTITFGKSVTLRTGEPVVALGAALKFPASGNPGTVTSPERSVVVPLGATTKAELLAAVPTDAAINPGNTGGALVDCQGALVGVPSIGAVAPGSLDGARSGTTGIRFAVPSGVARSVSDQLITAGHVTHSVFGLQVAGVFTPTSGSTNTGGLFVLSITPGGPSAAAKLQRSDVITELDGVRVASAEVMEALTLAKHAGDVVRVGYRRNGVDRTVNVTLGAAPAPEG